MTEIFRGVFIRTSGRILTKIFVVIKGKKRETNLLKKKKSFINGDYIMKKSFS